MTEIETWAARVLCFIAALVIVAIAEPKLNAITDQARPGFRVAFVLLTVAGVWTVIDLLSGAVPPWSAVALRVAIALLLIEERHCPRSCARGSAKHHVPLTRHDRAPREASLLRGLRRTD